MKPIRNLIALFTAGLMLINLLVVAVLALSTRQSRVQYEDQTKISSQNLAQVLDENIKGIIDRVDLTLLSVTDETERQIRGGGIQKEVINAYIVHQFERVPELASLRMTNANGDIVYGTGVVPGINIADRDYFYYQRDDSSKGVTISKPYLSRTTGKWQVSISRRIRKPDGSFAGIAYGNVMLDYFTRMFSRINVGMHGAIAMWNNDLELIARYPDPKQAGSEETLKLQSTAFSESIRVAKEMGTYTTQSKVDNIERSFSYRKISKYPIYILVGMATQDYLAPWRKEAVRKSVLGVCFLLFSCLFTFLFYKHLTVSKRAEEALRESEERFRSLSNASLEGIMIHKQGVILDANLAFARTFGYEQPEELIGKNGLELLLPPESRARILQRIQRQEQGPLEVTGVRKDGTTFTMETESQPAKYIGHDVRIVSCRDITERKQAAQALQESEERYRQITKCVPDLIWTMDLSGRFTYVNSAVERIKGWTVEEFLKLSFRDVVTPQEAAKDQAVIEEELMKATLPHYDRNTIRTFESEQLRKDGSIFLADVSAAFLWSDDGKPVGIIGTTRDISERKRVEEEREKLQAQLYQSQKMESVGMLAGGIAHDFNNMLTAIIGYASILQTKLGTDSPFKPYVDQILGSSEKSASLTSQLLAFSRKQILSPKETDLNELLKGIDTLMKRLIGEDIEFKTSLTDKRLTAMIDAGQMEQVLLNLCTNARDAMPHGGLLAVSTNVLELDEKRIRTYDLDQPGRYAIISISDTGHGMEEMTRERIFEPFYTTKDIGKGTGLGLSIVYGIIKQHNGNITVYSEPGKGTTFKIFLPLIVSPVETANKESLVIPMGGKEAILVSEDDEVVRSLASHVLQEAGYTVIEAVDGDDAINKFMENKDRIKLAILDVVMPKKSGKEVSDAVRKMKSDMKILLTSGYTADIISSKGITEEGLDFISKPITPDNLLRKVREVLDS